MILFILEWFPKSEKTVGVLSHRGKKQQHFIAYFILLHCLHNLLLNG